MHRMQGYLNKTGMQNSTLLCKFLQTVGLLLKAHFSDLLASDIGIAAFEN